MALDVEELAGVVDGQSNAAQAIRDGATASVLALWQQFDAWYDGPAIGALTAAVLSSLRANKRATASLTNAYVTRTIAATAGGKRRPAARLVNVDALRTDPFTGQAMTPPVLQHAYGRPADQYRYQRATRANELESLLSTRALPGPAQARVEDLRTRYTVEQLRETRGLEFDDTEFRQLALQRAEAVVVDELKLAERHQGRKTLQDDGRPQAYRRILHPELSSESGVCGLCVAACDRVYYLAELLPIHTGCNCTVLPIIGGVDPGKNLNAADLDALYQVAGSTYAEDLIRVRIKVTEHGELGPALAQFNADPKTAQQVRRNTQRRRRPDAGGTPDPED